MTYWTLSKEFRFEASHQLMHHDGKCAQLHGHSWRGVLTIVGGKLQERGPKQNMLMDYGDIGKVLQPIIELLDHRHLNVVLNTDMPTSELLAMWVFDRVNTQIQTFELRVKCVRIEETCTTACEYAEV